MLFVHLFRGFFGVHEQNHERYRDAGADQMIVGALSQNPKSIKDEIERLAEKLVVPSAKL